MSAELGEWARLDAVIRTAHASGDKGALVKLYTQAADLAQTEAATAYFLTQAYIFALDTGHSEASALKDRLRAMGRER